MADPAYTPDHPAETPDHPAEDETIYSTPHRRLIIEAGKLARAEQERLERETVLEKGRTPKPDPGGYFP
jgi:hypothetical protein